MPAARLTIGSLCDLNGHRGVVAAIRGTYVDVCIRETIYRVEAALVWSNPGDYNFSLPSLDRRLARGTGQVEFK